MCFAFIAQAAQSSPGFGGMLIPILLMLGVMYFLMLRPQMKKQKEHTKMLNSLGRGDDIVTSGGIHGKVIGLNEKDNTLQVQIAKGIIVNLERGSVARIKSIGGAEITPAETKPSEPKSRRQGSEPSSREPASSNQPTSGMVVTGTRMTGADRFSSEGAEGGTKKSRYRRSRRRKPSYQQGPQAQPGRGPTSDGSSESNPTPAPPHSQQDSAQLE